MNIAARMAPVPDEIVARKEIDAVIEREALSMVFHPVMDLNQGTMLGTEALARIGDDPARTPRDWFAQAARVGRQTELEVLAVRMALRLLPKLPPAAFIFVNATPQAVASVGFHALISADVADRVIIDISVDAPIAGHASLVDAVRALRRSGARISIDDAGNDRRSWLRIEELEPEVIKLGPDITRGMTGDGRARGVARHFLAFAADIHADVIAEAIETEAEKVHLIDLGVVFGQGYLFGRPAPLAG